MRIGSEGWVGWLCVLKERGSFRTTTTEWTSEGKLWILRIRLDIVQQQQPSVLVGWWRGCGKRVHLLFMIRSYLCLRCACMVCTNTRHMADGTRVYKRNDKLLKLCQQHTEPVVDNVVTSVRFPGWKSQKSFLFADFLCIQKWTHRDEAQHCIPIRRYGKKTFTQAFFQWFQPWVSTHKRFLKSLSIYLYISGTVSVPSSISLHHEPEELSTRKTRNIIFYLRQDGSRFIFIHFVFFLKLLKEAYGVGEGKMLHSSWKQSQIFRKFNYGWLGILCVWYEKLLMGMQLG